MSEMIKAVEAEANAALPEIRPGDTVSVHVRIKEGDRERIQEFRGTVIRLRKGGNNANFTVRRLASHGVLPAALATHREGRSPAPGQGPPGAALLPAPAVRQAGAS